MNVSERIRGIGGFMMAALLAGAGMQAQPTASLLSEGSVLRWDGHSATVKRFEALPHVQNEFTQRFRFDSADNPKLQELRRRYRLDEVVAEGQDEFDRQVRLLDWVHHRFKKFGRPSVEAQGALEILAAIDKGHSFFSGASTRVRTGWKCAW